MVRKYLCERIRLCGRPTSGAIKKLTTDGNRNNGTFDWVYEEEFFCRDGFRWSPDSRQLAYWAEPIRTPRIDDQQYRRHLSRGCSVETHCRRCALSPSWIGGGYWPSQGAG